MGTAVQMPTIDEPRFSVDPTYAEDMLRQVIVSDAPAETKDFWRDMFAEAHGSDE